MGSLREEIEALRANRPTGFMYCLHCLDNVLAIFDKHDADLNNALTADQFLKQRMADPVFAAEYESAKKRVKEKVSLESYLDTRNGLYRHWVGRREDGCNSFREAYNAGFEDGVKARIVVDAYKEGVES